MISVCMASYNGEKYIEEQISSVLGQLSSSDELLISDDGSSDRTIQIVLEIAYSDERVKLLDGPQLGLQKNFENACKQAKGEFVFLCDQDDVWKPNKVKLMLDKLSDYDLVVSDCNVVDQDLKVLYNSFFEINDSGSGLVRNLVKNSYLGCCIAFNRKVLGKALPFPDGIPMHDWWIGLVAQSVGTVTFLDRPLINYRRHGSNASPTSEVSKNNLWTKFTLRKKILVALVIRVLF